MGLGNGWHSGAQNTGLQTELWNSTLEAGIPQVLETVAGRSPQPLNFFPRVVAHRNVAIALTNLCNAAPHFALLLPQPEPILIVHGAGKFYLLPAIRAYIYPMDAENSHSRPQFYRESGGARARACRVDTRVDARLERLAQLVLDFLQPVRTLQDLARLATVGRADDAFVLHHVQNPRRAAVAQAEAALQG